MNGTLTHSFEQVLAALLETHEGLLALMVEQRSAMGRADSAALAKIAERQQELSARILGLEDQRRDLARQLAGPGSGVQTRVQEIAAGLPEPARGRIAGLAGRLREVLLRLQEQSRILREAASALSGHMDGLMQQVAIALGRASGMGAGTYGRRGRVEAGAPACALDMSH